jgi:myo-inositol 2-dehydrogenase/D-chiro-inositol 1-dehydrogenase
VEIEVDAPAQHPEAAGSFRRIALRYADGCRIILGGDRDKEETPFIEGPKGKVFRGFRSTIPNLKEKLASLTDPEAQITDFMESVRTRRPFALNELNGHRSATLVNLSKIAWQLGRSLHFDTATQRCPGDDAANHLIDPPMRAPWHL